MFCDRHRTSSAAAAVLTVLLLGVVSSGTDVRAEILVNEAGWRFPNVITAAKEAIRVSDRTPLIEGKETILRGYRRADGTRFMTYEIEGRIFGVEIDTDGKPPFEFSILDTNGDGKYESKIPHTKGNKDRAYVPQWVIDHYFAAHPDLKNPKAGGHSQPPSLKATAPAPPPVATGAAPPPPPAPPAKKLLEQPNP